MALTLIGTPLVLTTSDTALCEYDITSGIDDTYDSYEFHFANMHPETNNVDFSFQVNAYDPSAGTPQLTGFNETMTTTHVEAYHLESDAGTPTVTYGASYDQAEGVAAYNIISRTIGNDADQSASGVLTLYAPSSTTYVKHFLSDSNASVVAGSSYTFHSKTAGYINTALAITQISFKMSSGDIHAGTIKMFGVS
jgi:hypothetical protein